MWKVFLLKVQSEDSYEAPYGCERVPMFYMYEGVYPEGHSTRSHAHTYVEYRHVMKSECLYVWKDDSTGEHLHKGQQLYVRRLNILIFLDCFRLLIM